MQRFYFFLGLFLVLGVAQTQAQTCTPDSMLADTAIIKPVPVTEEMPDAGISDTACVNQTFGFTFTLRTPDTIELAGNQVRINSIILDSVGALTGLPDGFSYTCNPPNCEFLPDSLGCLYLFGTPAEGSEGTYDLGLDVVVNADVFGTNVPFPLSLPDATIAPGNYFLNVRPEGFANCAPVSVRELHNDFFAVAVAPNPARDVATIQVQSEINLDSELRLFNAAGQRVASQPIRILMGESYHQVDVRSLPSGFYIFTIGEGSRAISGRLSVLH